jgi:hypothetical protein
MKIATPTDWKTKPLPKKRKTIPLDRRFTPTEMGQISKGFIPLEMEDKWFIYYKESTLFIYRSWTGYCIYVVKFVEDRHGASMIQAYINRDRRQYGGSNDERDAKIISWVIDFILLGRNAEFPSDES